MHSSVSKLFVLFLLFVGGNLLTLFILIALMVAQGNSMSESLLLLQGGMENMPSGLIRTSVWVQTLATFILPALAYGLIYHRNQFGEYLGAHKVPTLAVFGLATLIMIAGYPLVQASYELNRLIPISDWMSTMEQSAMSVMEEILLMDSVWSLITTLFIVAVLPAIGEELIFRGILQQELGKLFNSKHLGVWLGAILFSAIHLQFEGFLPRMILGAILGYLYLWTKSIWVPIFVHFLNNGVQVLVLYYSGIDLSSEELSSDPSPWWGVALGAVILFAASARLLKIVKPDEQ